MPKPKKATAAVIETAPQFMLTPEEIQAIIALREAKMAPAPSTASSEAKVSVAELAQAMAAALQAIKPIEKKTVATRKKMNPWMPTDGSPKILQFKRPMYQHGIEIDPKCTKNETCLLLDKVKPGKYCNGLITVTKRKNGGLDIDYPIRTSAQRLKVNSQFDVSKGFDGLLERLIAERADPKKYAPANAFDDDNE